MLTCCASQMGRGYACPRGGVVAWLMVSALVTVVVALHDALLPRYRWLASMHVSMHLRDGSTVLCKHKAGTYPPGKAASREGGGAGGID